MNKGEINYEGPELIGKFVVMTADLYVHGRIFDLKTDTEEYCIYKVGFYRDAKDTSYKVTLTPVDDYLFEKNVMGFHPVSFYTCDLLNHIRMGSCKVFDTEADAQKYVDRDAAGCDDHVEE